MARTKKQKEEQQEALWESNPERYAKCSQPFATDDDANAAVKAFFDAISELREKHLIADVEILVKDSFGSGTDVRAFMSTAHFGSALEREAMLAYALGQAQKQRQAMIGALLAGGGRASD